MMKSLKMRMNMRMKVLVFAVGIIMFATSSSSVRGVMGTAAFDVLEIRGETDLAFGATMNPAAMLYDVGTGSVETVLAAHNNITSTNGVASAFITKHMAMEMHNQVPGNIQLPDPAIVLDSCYSQAINMYVMVVTEVGLMSPTTNGILQDVPLGIYLVKSDFPYSSTSFRLADPQSFTIQVGPQGIVPPTDPASAPPVTITCLPPHFDPPTAYAAIAGSRLSSSSVYTGLVRLIALDSMSPGIVWSTTVGNGIDDTIITGVYAKTLSNMHTVIYACGTATGTMPNAMGMYQGLRDSFVVLIEATISGGGIMWTLQVGSPGDDVPRSVFVHAESDRLFVTGSTTASYLDMDGTSNPTVYGGTASTTFVYAAMATVGALMQVYVHPTDGTGSLFSSTSLPQSGTVVTMDTNDMQDLAVWVGGYTTVVDTNAPPATTTQVNAELVVLRLSMDFATVTHSLQYPLDRRDDVAVDMASHPNGGLLVLASSASTTVTEHDFLLFSIKPTTPATTTTTTTPMATTTTTTTTPMATPPPGSTTTAPTTATTTAPTTAATTVPTTATTTTTTSSAFDVANDKSTAEEIVDWVISPLAIGIYCALLAVVFLVIMFWINCRNHGHCCYDDGCCASCCSCCACWYCMCCACCGNRYLRDRDNKDGGVMPHNSLADTSSGLRGSTLLELSLPTTVATNSNMVATKKGSKKNKGKKGGKVAPTRTASTISTRSEDDGYLEVEGNESNTDGMLVTNPMFHNGAEYSNLQSSTRGTTTTSSTATKMTDREKQRSAHRENMRNGVASVGITKDHTTALPITKSNSDNEPQPVQDVVYDHLDPTTMVSKPNASRTSSVSHTTTSNNNLTSSDEGHTSNVLYGLSIPGEEQLQQHQHQHQQQHHSSNSNTTAQKNDPAAPYYSVIDF